jgi:hypothetical protein
MSIDQLLHASQVEVGNPHHLQDKLRGLRWEFVAEHRFICDIGNG